MIRVYGYYSCGGYKDMYLGNDEMSDSPSYFLPLLPRMRERKNADDLSKLETLEQLKQIEIITNEDCKGFPKECNTMFSHGGYFVIYKTLSDNGACLAVRDIPSLTTDEEERNIPFKLMFVAYGEDSIRILDNLAIAIKEDYSKWIYFLSTLFTYDAKVNGIKFDLPKLFGMMLTIAPQNMISHKKNRYVYLMVGSIEDVKIGIKEQSINVNMLDCIIDTKGNLIKGKIPMIKGVAIDEVEERKEQKNKWRVNEDNSGESCDEELKVLVAKVMELSENIQCNYNEIERILQEIKTSLNQKDLDNNCDIDKFPFNTKWFRKLIGYKDYYLILAVTLIVVLLIL